MKESPRLLTNLEPSLPSSWYRSEAIFALEKERIFCREWVCVGREKELSGPGAYRVIDVLGESIIVLRNRGEQLRAFYNVCRHRGARLCQASSPWSGTVRPTAAGVVSGRRIVCPYHQWTYNLDGELIAAPHLLNLAGFEKSNFSLYPVGVGCWGGCIFVNLSPATAKPLPEQIGAIAERTRRYPLEDLRIGYTIQYQVAANWKLICENNNECYHCGGVHPELCAVVPAFREHGGSALDWQSGIPHRPGAYTFTKSGTTARRAFPTLDADEQVRHKGELLYPNLFLSLSCDHVAMFILMPRDAGHVAVTCHFLFESHEITKAEFDPKDTVEFWDVVNRQDWAICECVQQGIGARVHHHGYYAPMEQFNLDMRRYVMSRVGDAAEGM